MKMKNVPLAITAVLLTSFVVLSQTSDSMLRSVMQKDKASRAKSGSLPTLSAAEHLERGRALFDNRHFPEAREHFQKIFDNYPTDPAMAGALFMTGRSYMWEKQYVAAIPYFDRVSREYPSTKEGREGLAFKASCHVRIGRNAEAAPIYEQYTILYPNGERIESAYLNIIDALREAGQYDNANAWIEKTVQRFPGQASQTNALHARLRMEIHRQRWTEAVQAADNLLMLGNYSGAMAGSDEVKFLRATALEKAGRRSEAMAGYASVGTGASSYYGSLAAEKLGRPRVKATAQVTPSDFPVPFRAEVVQEAKKRGLDPRFVLAIMKQESTFNASAKSPSAARGLLQLTYDTAVKYSARAGFPNLEADDLYVPRTNIAIGCEYLASLRDQFGGLYEAIAASYNGGEDNAARWLNRSEPKEPGIFTSEIGFAETKNYTFKVMTNYRTYRDLYDENLNRR